MLLSALAMLLASMYNVGSEWTQSVKALERVSEVRHVVNTVKLFLGDPCTSTCVLLLRTMSALYFTWFLEDLKAPGGEEGSWHVMKVEGRLGFYNASYCACSENSSGFAVSHCSVL